MNKLTKVCIQIALVILILGGGILGLMKLKSMKQPPEKKPPIQYLPLVTTSNAETFNDQMVIKGFGTVKSKVQIELVPQVSGKVVKISPALVNGGFVKANEVLVEIEKIDFELQVQQAQSMLAQSNAAIKQTKAAIAQAKVNLEQEESEAMIAKEEWQQLNPQINIIEASPLALRIPQTQSAKSALDSAKAQLASAQAQLDSAKAKLAIAKLNLTRTDLSVPFHGRVASENIDHGQMATVNKAVATIYSIETVEIVVPLEDKELQWFDVPGLNSPNGSEAEIIVDFQGKDNHWTGKIVRSQGTIDHDSRMVNIVIEVDNPFECKDGKSPLVPGMFTEAHIKGKKTKNLIRLPDQCLHNGNEVWAVENNKLRMITFQANDIVRRDKDYVYIHNALKSGQMIISSQIDAVTEGMMVLMEGQDREDVLTKLKLEKNDNNRN